MIYENAGSGYESAVHCMIATVVGVSKCNFLYKDRHLIVKMVMSAIFNNPSIKCFSKQHQIL